MKSALKSRVIFCLAPFLFCSFPSVVVSLHEHNPGWTSSPLRRRESGNKFIVFSGCFSHQASVMVHTLSSCFSVSFKLTHSSSSAFSSIISYRLRVAILIFTSRSVFFAAVSRMWFHFLSCIKTETDVNLYIWSCVVWSWPSYVFIYALGTHVRASELISFSSLWSWDRWLFMCSHLTRCWSSRVCSSFLSCSTSSCSFFSFSESWSLSWRRFSTWTINDCTSSNCNTYTHRESERKREIVFETRT